MPRPDVYSKAMTDTLATAGQRTSSGTGSPVSGFGRTSWLRLQLACTAVSGLLPTLDVVLEDTIDGVNWNTVATFTQVAVTGRQVLNVQAPYTDQLRVRWTINGTSPSFTFGVIAYSQ